MLEEQNQRDSSANYLGLTQDQAQNRSAARHTRLRFPVVVHTSLPERPRQNFSPCEFMDSIIRSVHMVVSVSFILG